ncbi:hypothetical protein C8F01DRAFT_1081657 [Mycena amicta]|nr:hypothetical protein C8F01DRAFT_1081657 [Mycena amicta]
MDLPTELVWAIVHQIEDTESLKSCCLASSQLRIPSQRVLFHSFKIPPPRAAACEIFLRDSPHIAEHIYCINIELLGLSRSPLDVLDSYTERLPNILSQLETVRLCALDGRFNSPTMLRKRSSVLTQLERFQLSELHLRRLTSIPMPIFRTLVTLAPRLSFSMVSLIWADSEQTPSHNPEYAVERLCFEPLSDNVCRYFASARLPRLAHLKIDVNAEVNEHAFGLITNCADTLQTAGASITARSFTQLPALKRVEFMIRFHDRSSAWFRETVANILSPTVATSLTDVSIAYVPTYSPFSCPPYMSRDHILPLLDTALPEHPMHPRLEWVLDLSNARLDDGGNAVADKAIRSRNDAAFAAFVGGIELGMPVMYAAGRLGFEKISKKPKQAAGIPHIPWRDL